MKIGSAKQFLGVFFLLSCSMQEGIAISVSQNTPLVQVNMSLPSIPFAESSSKKLTDKITLKLNRDLFEKGLEIKTKGYGQYFASLEASNHFNAKFNQNPASTVLQRKIRQSIVKGGMRLGGLIGEKSKLYLKVGFESENFAAPNTLKTRRITSSNQGYWRTVMASGLGFEYGVTQKWAVLGEASTMALTGPLNGVLTQKKEKETPHTKASKFKGRDNRLLVGIRYHFGG